MKGYSSVATKEYWNTGKKKKGQLVHCTEGILESQRIKRILEQRNIGTLERQNIGTME